MHGCFVGKDSRLRCWGNGPGGLAPDRRPRRTPAIVEGLGSVQAVDVDEGITCIATGGGVACAIGSSAPKFETVAGVADAVGVAVAGEHVCSVDRTGRVQCWQHAWIEPRRDAVPHVTGVDKIDVRPVSVPGTVVQIAGSHSVFAARTSSGEVYCWRQQAAATPPSASAAPGAPAAPSAPAAPGAAPGKTTDKGRRGAASGAPDDADAPAAPVRIDAGTAARWVGAEDVDPPEFWVVSADGRQARLHACSAPGASIATADVEPGRPPIVAWESGGKQMVAGGRTERLDAFVSTQGHVTSSFRGEIGQTEIADMPAVRAIATAGNTACALDDRDVVRCWGSNAQGVIAGSPHADDWAPVTGVSDIASVATSCFFSAALRRSGEIIYWGNGDPRPRVVAMPPNTATAGGSAARVGGASGSPAASPSPSAAAAAANAAQRIALSEIADCEVLTVDSSNRVSCFSKFGRNTTRLTPQGIRNWRSSDLCWDDDHGHPVCPWPLSLPSSLRQLTGIQSISMVGKRGDACAIVGGKVRCFAAKGGESKKAFPDAHDPVDLHAVRSTICARESNGDLWCAPTMRGIPGKPMKILQHVVKLSCGGSECCAVLDNGRLGCFESELGSVSELALGAAVREVTTECGTTCAVDTAGHVFCRGDCGTGQCGPETPLAEYKEPIVVGNSGVSTAGRALR